MSKQWEVRARELLASAGVTIGGSAPYDLQVHDPEFYRRVFGYGSVGLGEAYMDGLWDCDDLAEFFARVLRSGADRTVMDIGSLWYVLRARWTNMQSRQRATQVAEEHYDIGNDLYVAMLDPYLQYTCGYWKNARDLDQAQEFKLDLICRKLGLREGMRVLDIGCGWGGFAKFAASRYGAHVTGISISKEQVAFARKETAGLPVDIRIEDYRDAKGSYDRIVTVGMIEHVGWRNYPEFMRKVHGLLAQDGLYLLHTIGSKETEYTSDPWFHKYIFPNGMLPSIPQLGAATNKLFVMEDWHNFGQDYDPTLVAWFRNFDARWPSLQEKYGERFYRMWKYYLLSMAGAFRARRTQLWQIVFSKDGVPGGYVPVR